MQTKITFTTIEEGFNALREEYANSEVVAGDMIDFIFSSDGIDLSIPDSVLHGAIQMFRSWDGEDDEVGSDGLNYSFPDGSRVPKGMRVGIADIEGIHIDENITVKGVVEQYKAFATMTTTLCLNIYAVSKNNAMGIAKKIDGGDFVEVEELSEWNVYDATPVEG